MSSVYSTEPTPTGRVILETNCGPIEIQLWCKECPTACRAFLQLATDQYFCSKPFHRILDKFLIQTGGIKTLQQCGGDIIHKKNVEEIKSYLKKRCDSIRYQNEVHARIRFNHRGIVAMALPLDSAGSDDSLNGQFFITLDEAPWLDGKHAAFGTVSGPTIFNALRIGRTDVKDDDTGMPMDMDVAPIVQSVKIIDNPFADLVASKNIPWADKSDQGEAAPDGTTKKKKKKRKGKRDLNVLSFGGDEEGDIGASIEFGNSRMKSSHDVVAKGSTFLLGAVDNEILKKSNDIPASRVDEKSVSRNKRTEKRPLDNSKTLNKAQNRMNSLNGNEEGKDVDFAEKMRSQMLERREKLKINRDDLARGEGGEDTERNGHEAVDSKGRKQEKTIREKMKEHKRQRKDLLARHGRGEKNVLVGIAGEKAMGKHRDKGLASEVQAMRAKYVQRKKVRGSRDDDTFAKLQAFQSKLHSVTRKDKVNDTKAQQSCPDVAAYSGQMLDENSDEDVSGTDWLKTKFKCKKHIDHASRGMDSVMGDDGRNINDYIVIDNRTEQKDEGTFVAKHAYMNGADRTKSYRR